MPFVFRFFFACFAFVNSRCCSHRRLHLPRSSLSLFLAPALALSLLRRLPCEGAGSGKRKANEQEGQEGGDVCPFFVSFSCFLRSLAMKARKFLSFDRKRARFWATSYFALFLCVCVGERLRISMDCNQNVFGFDYLPTLRLLRASWLPLETGFRTR